VTAIETCERTTTLSTTVLRGAEPSNEDLCLRVMDLTAAEMGESASEVSAVELDTYLAKCIADLEKERHTVGVVEFRREQVCIMAAPNLPEMMRCEPSANDEPPPPPPPPPPAPMSIGEMMNAVEAERSAEAAGEFMSHAIYAPNPEMKDLQETKAARFDKVDGTVVIGFCVEITGETSEIHTIQAFPDDPQVDQILLDVVARWRFKPFMRDGKPIKACSKKTFNLNFH
jgi:hypothetical protein